MSTPLTSAPITVLVHPTETQAWVAERRARGRRIALVPTMGALHDGHYSLIHLAQAHADDVIVSIFVNPLQFDRHDDFSTYPRPIDDDVRGCAATGAAAVYAPTAAVMYPPGFETHVAPGPLGDVMEGAMRPGHFRGVTTVVTKLFGACRPDVAVFGEKDFQQLSIIRRMVIDLDLGIDILPAPIVREEDGLAMSSRNRKLGDEDRRAARCVPLALEAAEALVARGVTDAAAVEAAARTVIDAEPRARLEYVTVFDPDSLESLTEIDGPARVALAAWLGDEVRLIDNRSLVR